MNVRIQFPLTFTAGIFYDNQLQMNSYMLKLYMITNSIDGNVSNIAFDRIKHFIYNEIESSIFINSIYKEQCELYNNAGIKITTLPGDPVDQLIGIMLQHKLTAITEGRLIVAEIEISSELCDGLIYMHAEGENLADLNVPEWWQTSDLIHCDNDLINSEKILSIHQNSIWRDLDLIWPNDDKNEQTENTVFFADFKKIDETE